MVDTLAEAVSLNMAAHWQPTVDQVKRFKELERESAQPREIVADQRPTSESGQAAPGEFR